MLLGLPLLATCRLAAQQRVQAAADTGHTDQRVFADILAGNSFSDVVLGAGVVYRLELRPVGGDLPTLGVSISPFPPNGLPPLIEYPLSDPNIVTNGFAYLLKPKSTGMYRVRVSATDQVDVRIYRDARETERLQRIMAGIATPSTLAGLSLRAVWIGGFSKPIVTPFGAQLGKASAVAPELCLGMAPHLPLVGDRLKGCALVAAWYQRSGTAPILSLGVSPHYLLTGEHGWTRTYAALTLAFGGPTGPNTGSNYTMIGPALGMDHQFGARLRAEVEAGIMIMHTISSSRTDAPPRVAAGLQYLF